MSSCALDASAVLAYLHREPGHRRIAKMLDGAHISAVNVAEVASKLAEKGDDEDQLREVIGALGLTVVPFDEGHAYRAAALRPLTSTAGLSLGDRACVATAQILGVKAVTADQSWSKLNLAVEVQVIR